MTQAKTPAKHIETMEDVLHNPRLAPFDKQIAPFLHKGNKIFYSKSYLRAQQGNIRRKLQCLPDWPLPKVLAQILGELPDGIQARMLLELTQFTVEQWEAREQKVEVKELVA